MAVKESERQFILECIQLYRTLPALWKIKCKDYNNKIVKHEQYDILLRKYQERYPEADRTQLIKRLNSLRTNFRKEVKRINEFIKSGADVGPTLWYFEEMSFLQDQEEQSTSQSIVQIQEATEDPEADYKAVDKISVQTVHDECPPKKLKKDDTEQLISLACKRLRQPETEYHKIANVWAVELEKMQPLQQLFAKKAINDILFEGQMGNLHRDSVQINRISYSSRTSSPHSEPPLSPTVVFYDEHHNIQPKTE